MQSFVREGARGGADILCCGTVEGWTRIELDNRRSSIRDSGWAAGATV